MTATGSSETYPGSRHRFWRRVGGVIAAVAISAGVVGASAATPEPQSEGNS
ncbi:MAG TPA: hypothetical protein VEX15_13860 [Nocardioidaceae bacterium]|nr:hypothetical protein [Nocardioidaceae bacterium]